MQEMEITYFDELELKGVAKGVLQGKRETLLWQLTAKFGPLTKRTRVQPWSKMALSCSGRRLAITG